ncbi:MAG: PKD domain-containing protein [Ferruginibacter sp.]
MKRSLLLLLVGFSCLPVFARHITGGEVIYDYIGPGASNSKIYRVTLRLFRDNLTMGGAAMPASVSIGIFNNAGNAQVGGYLNVPLVANTPVGIISSPPCLTNPPVFDYSVGTYIFTIDLPNNGPGYTVTYQTCCRVSGITNGGGDEGATYTSEIPGTNTLTGGINDNSARFVTGISIICYNQAFILDFSATDPDGDSLAYSLTNAYDGGAATDAAFAFPAPPPYGSINYFGGYSGLSPLGAGASINTSTGIISGIAPGAGKYVVSVVVRSYRNGQYISEHRKDFIITVAPCDFASADLNPVYTSCDIPPGGFNVSFENLNNSPLNLTFDWNFGDPASGANNNSTLEMPTHIYSTAGDYNLTLIVNANTPCADTAYAIVKVYPGFFPAFGPVPSMCKDLPVQFSDATTTNYGTVNYWHWDFGVTTLSNDTSRLQNPTYTYNTAGTYNAAFIVGTDKGCRDTLFPIVVTIIDKPDFFISNDTLICTVDTLQLLSNVTTGTITWSPNYMISDVNSFNPFVSPDVPTTYTVTYSDPSGCTASDQVFVNVVNEVTLLAINDTTICLTDTARLLLNTDALYFTWTPTNLIIDPTVRNPQIIPVDPVTVFHVKASISNKCFKEKDITVSTIPYPVAVVSGDQEVCYGKDAQLQASGGTNYLWSPPAYLNSAVIPNPKAIFPKLSLTYTVSVTDTLGCPKPAFATITVNVIRLFANAGPSDTSVVLGQPLQLTATGSEIYLWTPDTYLNNPNIANPVSLPQNNITYTVSVSNAAGCTANDTINVKVYFLPPDMYVPSAFTPGKDRVNDLFRPIALGIRSLESFRVFNRWGQLVYITSRINDGWDGTFKGVGQDSGTFVWQVNATDYKGNKIFKKGTVILIR